MVDIKSAKEFTMNLIKFYKSFIAGSVDSIKILADIQKNNPKEYELLIRLKNDPTAMEDAMTELSQEDKNVLMIIFIRASHLGNRLNNLFESTVDDKIKLAKDLEEFSNYVEEELSKLEKKYREGVKK